MRKKYKCNDSNTNIVEYENLNWNSSKKNNYSFLSLFPICSSCSEDIVPRGNLCMGTDEFIFPVIGTTWAGEMPWLNIDKFWKKKLFCWLKIHKNIHSGTTIQIIYYHLITQSWGRRQPLGSSWRNFCWSK